MDSSTNQKLARIINFSYECSLLKKLAEKGVWDLAEVRANGDRKLLEYLVCDLGSILFYGYFRTFFSLLCRSTFVLQSYGTRESIYTRQWKRKGEHDKAVHKFFFLSSNLKLGSKLNAIMIYFSCTL